MTKSYVPLICVGEVKMVALMGSTESKLNAAANRYDQEAIVTDEGDKAIKCPRGRESVEAGEACLAEFLPLSFIVLRAWPLEAERLGSQARYHRRLRGGERRHAPQGLV